MVSVVVQKKAAVDDGLGWPCCLSSYRASGSTLRSGRSTGAACRAVCAAGATIQWNNWRSPLISLHHSLLTTWPTGQPRWTLQSADLTPPWPTSTSVTTSAWDDARDTKGVGSYRYTHSSISVISEGNLWTEPAL